MTNKKILFIGIVSIIIFLILMVFIVLTKNNNDNNTFDLENRNALYKWQIYKIDYTGFQSSKSNTYSLTDFVLYFYENKLVVCSYEHNDCEESQYIRDENYSITINNENSIFNPFKGTYYITETKNEILLEKNFESGSSAIYHIKEYKK